MAIYKKCLHIVVKLWHCSFCKCPIFSEYISAWRGAYYLILADHWLKLAPKLGVADDKLKEIKAKDAGDEEKCLELLTLWQEIEGEGATRDEIVYILEGLKLASCIEGVF